MTDANLVVASPSAARGSGCADDRGGAPFEFDVHSGPSGEDPTGQVTFAALSGSTPVTCLDVRSIPFGAAFDQATMNLATAGFGLVNAPGLRRQPRRSPGLHHAR